VILLLAILALAITTATLIAAQADASARARAEGVRARLAAESAARVAAASWEPAPIRALGLLDQHPLPTSLRLPGNAGGRASVRRVGPDVFLVLAEGAAGQARARAAMLVRILSITSLLSPFPAALASGEATIAVGARVDVLPPDAPPTGWPSQTCDSGAADTLTLAFGEAARPGVYSTGLLTVQSPDVGGFPPIAHGSPQPVPAGLGPLEWSVLARRADRIESGAIALAPVANAGRCETAAPGNWGDPRDRTSPCWTYMPLIYAPGDLRLTAGSGQGVLVVRGRLIVDGGVDFYGPILAGGGAQVSSGATLWGALAATPLEWAGSVTYSPCVILRALSSAPGLGRPFRAGRRLWARFF
jgi:hypothetical protein